MSNPSFWQEGKRDFHQTVHLFLGGFKKQFQEPGNIYYLSAGIPLTWYSFESDGRIQRRYGGRPLSNITNHIGDAGVLLSFPFVPLALYTYGKKKNRPHQVQFAKEYFAATYLALIESGLLSHFYIHSRPSSDNLSFWEKAFRGKSSWPSGHTIPYATLFFKTWQFYGPLWATLPLGLTVISSIQRIKDKKHHLSDVVGSFFLAAFASEGVRAAAGYDKNHPLYKSLFEKDFTVALIPWKHSLDLKVGLSF